MTEKTTKLLELMKSNELSCTDVALLVGRRPSTVRVWMVETGNNPQIPDAVLELLELKLAQQANQ